ncbi:hypothetical protein G5V65_21045 [Rhodobacter sp. HX-7-19]|uniref:Uncharacterized protein n=1 Tax=Paragemmobacter kunshanensis TaxID=2583234 RepID=A0A6M1U0W7_9RHOB|nr:hypothetical protein [Rhodobacter kunshanensis]NGQ93377.1 hypothetical protein [Rhodobacter kunshanensis]
MTITRISSATGTNSLTMPSHAAGDLLLMFAYRDGSTTAPALPAGWTDLNNGGTATNSCRIAYKIAASGSEVSGTWTNATSLICLVYRSDGIIGVGGVARSSAASTTVSYPALTMVNTDGTSWVAGFGAHRSVNTSVETPPTGMTNITSVLDATDEAAAHDTNGPVSSWSLTTVSVGGTSSGWIGATVEITDEPLPVPPSGDNPCTIMADPSEVDLFFDAALSDLFEDTAGTTAATTDGDPVNFVASLWGADFVAGASSGRNAVLRLPGGDDPYLEAVPGSSQLRASIARSGDLYVICRGRWNGTGDDQESFWVLHENPTQFYTGDFIKPTYFPFGFNYIQTESSIGYAVTTSATAITRGAWATLEIYVSGSTIYTAVDGGSFETYAGSGPLGDTTLMDIFGSLDGGVTGSFAVDIRRLALLNTIPDSTERAALLDWAENGDTGGSAGITGSSSGSVGLTGSASGEVDIAGTVAGSLPITGASAGVVSVAGQGAGDLPLAGSGAGAVGNAPATGTASGTLDLTGASAGAVAVRGQASGSMGLTGAAAGAVAVSGAASGSMAFTGAAAGAVRVAGQGAGVLDLPGSASGSVAIEGSASGDLPLTGAATGAIGNVPVTGAAAGDLPIGGAAAGAVSVRGAASGAFGLSGAGQGAVRVAGTASGDLPLAGAGQGTTRVAGAAVGDMPLAGAGAGAVAVEGAAVGSLDLGGVGAGTAQTQGTAATVAITGTWRGHAVGGTFGARRIAGSARAHTITGTARGHVLAGLWDAETIDTTWRAA